ncbi:MAG: stage III sporulation protein AF [Oscillospiraceae bacterium]|nr:stage III sporulation protein AF [Oscillospiraceae bacterium]
MIEGVRTWLLGIVLTSLAGGLARQLAPQGKEQAMVRLVSGLLLALAILRPLAGNGWDGLEVAAGGFAVQSEEQAEVYRKKQQEAFSAIIAEKTEAYILDKASQLGLDCTVRVTVTAGESGIPLPSAATIRGAYSPALAECMEEEVGIPAQKQIWLEEEIWQTEKESES